MGLTLLRRAAWAAVALLALVVALLVLAHTPPAASRVRERLFAEVAARWRLDLQATTLDYNALTRRIALAEVRVAAQGHADEPFFVARRVTVTLPWAVYLGRLRLTSLVVEDGRVRLVRENGEIVNLPPSSGEPPPATPRRLDVRGLTVRNLDVEYVDRTGDVEVTVRGLETAFTEGGLLIPTGAGGTIGARSLTARVGERSTSSGALQGRAAFDGSNVSLEAFTIPLREGTVVVDGRVDRALDDLSFALTLHGTLDVAAASEWVPPPTPVSGAGTFDGTMQGPLGGYTLRASFAVPQLRVGRAEALPMEGEATLTSDGVVVDRFQLTAPGRADGRPGVIEGRFTYEFGDDGPLALTASWRDLDLDVALAAADVEPLPIASWQAGQAAMTRATPDAPLALEASGRSTPLARAGRIALDGSWRATLERERWTAVHDHRVLDTARVSGTARWAVTEPATAAALDGPLDVEAADLGGAVRAARRSGLELPEALQDVQGPLRGDLMLGGTLERPLVQGALRSDALVLPTGTAATLEAQLAIGEQATDVSAFTLSGQGVHVSGEAHVDGASGALSGAFAAEVGSVAEFAAPWLGAVEGLTGSARLSGTFGGTTDAVDVPWELTSSRVMYGEQPIGAITANGRVLGTAVRVERLRLEQDEGDAEAAGEYDVVSGAYTASLQARGLQIGRPLLAEMADAVIVDARFDGRGTIEAPGGAGSLRLTPQGGRLGDLVGVTNVQWQFNGRLVDARLFVPKLRVLADVNLDPQAPYALRGTAAVSALDVEPFAVAGGAAPGAVTGAVGLSATFAGTLSDTSSLEAFVNLQEAALVAGGVPVRLERPARLSLRADDFSVDDLYLHVGGGLLTASGRLNDPSQAPLSVWFGGPVADLATMARAFGLVADVDASGELNVWWESTGGVERASATATLTNGRVVWQDFPPLEALQVNGRFDGAVVDIDELRATWQGGGIEGKARLPRGVLFGGGADRPSPPGRIDIAVRGLTQHALQPWLSEEVLASLDARVSATIGLDVSSPSMEGVSGLIVLDEATVTAAGVPIRQERPAYLSFTRGILTFDDVAFSAAEPVYIGGSITFGDSPALDVSLTGSPGLRPFSVLMPNVSVDGVAKLGLYVSGTFAAPRVDGRIDLSDGELVMREPRVIASDVAGPILFQGDRIIVSGLTGTLNGGSLDASGTVRFAGVEVAGGEIAFQARNVAVEYPADVHTEIDALLVFAPGPGAPALRGDVRLLRGAYRGTISLPALVAFNNAPAAPPDGGYLDTVRLDIAISTEDPLVVDNNYGQFESTVDLRLQGTVGRPGVTGRAELLEGGEMFLLGGVYRLDQSSISFVNPAAIEPDLDISMTTRSAGAELTITLSGPLSRLETDVVSSDPNATDTSLVSVLLGGNSLGGEDALALLSGELLGATGRAIGLDTLRLERGFNEDVVRQDPGLVAEEGFDPSMRLTISKRLRSDVEVILSQNLRESGGLAAVVSYRPWQGVELRATQRDNTDRAYTVRHEISFGGSPVPRAAPRPRQEIAAVVFDGAGADEAALRERLRQKPGERFDFGAWRDDVDRLTAWYHDRNHLEARVRSSRTEREDGRIDLLYRVAPGPETLFVIGGIESTPRLAERVESIWAGSIFDRFLLEELQREVALELVRRDVVGATVEAVVRSDTPEQKIVAVEVRGGQPARRRELRFPGMEAFTRGALEDALRARGLYDYAWIDPATVVEPLTDLYHAAGYRAAAVRPELPRFEGDTAVLTVAIDEGPITRVAGVRFEGVDPAEEDAVRRAAAIAEGQAYRPADVEEARRRVEAQYRQRGYNEVAVMPQAAVDDAQATAAIVFAVQPGPQQVLTEVTVAGTTRTRPGAVTRALGLHPGTPVDFTQWALARKRVFDTNVFRQVEVRPEELPITTPGIEPVRAQVTVAEWPAWRVRYGLQLNDRSLTEQGGDTTARRQDLGVVADIQNRNVFGRAFTLGLYGRVERRLQSSNAYVTFPTLFGRAVQTNVFASASLQDLSFDETSEPEFRRTRELVSIEQRIRRGRGFEATYGYRLTHEVIDGLDPADLFFQETVIGRFTGAAFIDRRDDPFDATRGWFTSFTAERVSNFESGDDSIKLLGAAYYYRPIGPVTLASALRIGGSFLDPLGFSERFYVGGADTVRGYAESAAGPKNILGLATGGDAQLILNQELRTPIFRWVKGVAFIDAGNVFLSNRDVSLKDLDVGYGVGLRLDTPFSLFRVDFGIPGRGGAKRWYFGIGQVF